MADILGDFDGFKEMLDKIHFSEKDKLYVLGNCIGGHLSDFEVLFEIMKHPNIIPIFGEVEYDLLNLLANNDWECKNNYALNLRYIWNKKFAESREDLACYLHNFKYFDIEKTEAGMFFLCHSGIGHFNEQGATVGLYDSFIAGSVDYGKKYFSNMFLVTGKQTTIQISNGRSSEIFKANNHIAINCGIYKRACICLDTLEEFYIDRKK